MKKLIFNVSLENIKIDLRDLNGIYLEIGVLLAVHQVKFLTQVMRNFVIFQYNPLKDDQTQLVLSWVINVENVKGTQQCHYRHLHGLHLANQVTLHEYSKFICANLFNTLVFY